MKKALDIHDYYFGVIVATPEYLENPKRHRYLSDVNFDPFADIDPFSAITFGTITLLKKEVKNGQERYIDQYNSIYRNELSYTLYEANKLGIVLAHVKPFSECYHQKPQWYMEEDFIEKCKDESFYFKHTYYISVKKTGEEAIVILNELPAESVQVEYFRQILGENQFQDIVQIYKNVYAKDISEIDANNDIIKQYHQLICNNDLSLGEFVPIEWMRRQLVASYYQDINEKKYMKRSEMKEN